MRPALQSPSRPAAVGATLGINLLAALAAVLTRMALREVSPYTFVWIATTIGAAVVVAYNFGWRRERIPRGLPFSVWRHMATMGLVNVVIGGVSLTVALRFLTASTLTYLLGYVSLLTMALSIVLLKERPTVLQWLGFGIALAGLRVYFWQVPPADDLRGLTAAGIGILALSYDNTLSRQIAVEAGHVLSNGVVTSVALFTGMVVLLPAALVFGWSLHVGSLTNLGVVLFRALVGIALVKTVWNLVMRTLRSYEVSILATSNIVWAALLSIPILHEGLTYFQIGGIAVMVAGLYVVQKHSPHSRAAAVVAAEELPGRRA